jgi:hypothetical protein
LRRHLGIAAGVLVLAAAASAEVPVARGAVLARDARATAPGAQRANGSSLESAAARADSTGRAVAMSLIGLAFAVAAIVLAFRRDFKEALGAFAVGVVAVLFATPAGVGVLRDTVATLFGAS